MMNKIKFIKWEKYGQLKSEDRQRIERIFFANVSVKTHLFSFALF